MTQEKIKRPVRQRRREAHERPSAEERPTDPGVSRSSIAITNRPRGTLLTRKYIAKGRFWEPSLWAIGPCIVPRRAREEAPDSSMPRLAVHRDFRESFRQTRRIILQGVCFLS